MALGLLPVITGTEYVEVIIPAPYYRGALVDNDEERSCLVMLGIAGHKIQLDAATRAMVSIHSMELVTLCKDTAPQNANLGFAHLGLQSGVHSVRFYDWIASCGYLLNIFARIGYRHCVSGSNCIFLQLTSSTSSTSRISWTNWASEMSRIDRTV